MRERQTALASFTASLKANRRLKSGSGGRFIFLGSKITVVGDCSHKIKRRLLLGRKAMANLDSVLKSKDITLLTLTYS